MYPMASLSAEEPSDNGSQQTKFAISEGPSSGSDHINGPVDTQSWTPESEEQSPQSPESIPTYEAATDDQSTEALVPSRQGIRMSPLPDITPTRESRRRSRRCARTCRNSVDCETVSIAALTATAFAGAGYLFYYAISDMMSVK